MRRQTRKGSCGITSQGDKILNTFVTVIVSVLVFGFLIFIHEFGHYITARIFGVTIQEFSIGMGPRIFSRISKKTGIRYSIAAFPIGGFVSMPGENGMTEEDDPDGIDYSNDPNTFDKKPAWQRFIIAAAGAAVNITAGFLAMILLTSLINIGNTTVREFHTADVIGSDVSSADTGLMVNDEILRIDGKRVVILDELSYEIMRRGNEPVDVLVIRDGKEILIEDVVFPTDTEMDVEFGIMDFKVSRVEKSFGSVMSYSFRKSVLIVRMCWESLYDLITGRYGFGAVSGPVGISAAIGNAAAEGFTSLLYIVVLISINLGVMNLLPLPALDGGRLLVLLGEMVTRKKLPPKVEMAINGIGFILLMILSVVIIIKDSITLLL